MGKIQPLLALQTTMTVVFLCVLGSAHPGPPLMKSAGGGSCDWLAPWGELSFPSHQ